jgi:hypothetical protein
MGPIWKEERIYSQGFRYSGMELWMEFGIDRGKGLYRDTSAPEYKNSPKQYEGEMGGR